MTRATIPTVSECPNRAILLIDEAAKRLHDRHLPQTPWHDERRRLQLLRRCDLREIHPAERHQLHDRQTPVIVDADQLVHIVSSTKQNLNNTRTDDASTTNSGVMVIAAVGRTSTYWYHFEARPDDTTGPRRVLLAEIELPHTPDSWIGNFMLRSRPAAVLHRSFRLADARQMDECLSRQPPASRWPSRGGVMARRCSVPSARPRLRYSGSEFGLSDTGVVLVDVLANRSPGGPRAAPTPFGQATRSEPQAVRACHFLRRSPVWGLPWALPDTTYARSPLSRGPLRLSGRCAVACDGRNLGEVGLPRRAPHVA